MIEKWVNFKRDYLEISFLRENCGYDGSDDRLLYTRAHYIPQTLNGDASYSNMIPWWIRVRWNVKPNCAITSCIRLRIRGQLLRGESRRNIMCEILQP